MSSSQLVRCGYRWTTCRDLRQTRALPAIIVLPAGPRLHIDDVTVTNKHAL
jgi:hypothetical protein